MVDVTDGADVHVRFFTFEYSLSHERNLRIRFLKLGRLRLLASFDASVNKKSWHRGLNPGPPPYQGGALPLSYASNGSVCFSTRLTSWCAKAHPTGKASPRHFQSLAKAVGAAEALKGEKYKPVIFIVKWGKEPSRSSSLAFRNSPDS